MGLDTGARTAVETCLGVKPNEHVLVVTDHLQREIGKAIYRAAEDVAAEATYMEMKPRSVSGEEPPAEVAAALREADVGFLVTYYSASHTDARRKASKAGARIASMPFTTESQDLVYHIFEKGGMTADYLRLKENVEAFKSRVRDAREVHITSPEGTDILLSLDSNNLPWDVDHGVIHEQGGFTNLPAGEVYCAPSNAGGVIVVDGSFGDWGLVPEPLRLTVDDCRVTKFEGGFSDRLGEYAEKLGPEVLNVAELGIGLNPRSDVIGVILEDEKAGGTVHIALGNNASFGGDVNVGFHFDGLIRHPLVEVDGQEVDLKRYLK